MTDTAIDSLLRQAAREALASGSPRILPAHLLMAITRLAENENGPGLLTEEFGRLGIEPKPFRRGLRRLLGEQARPGRPVAPAPAPRSSAVLSAAAGLAAVERVPAGPIHVLRAALVDMVRGEPERAGAAPPAPKPDPDRPASPRESLDLAGLTARLVSLRARLLDRVFGQEHAVHEFVEGLFNVEVVAAADTTRRKPAGLFVFAGPPGVGKTYLAEIGAAELGRPFERFDMSSYSQSHEVTGLVGVNPSYQSAKPGLLTSFVEENPNAVLLFDEIEKAHSAAVHLFLQILDAGRLKDAFTGREAEFRNTILIFTTNVGRSLYENENSSGVQRASAAFHRATLLDALSTEVDPHTRAPFFPAAICSRMATGCPILFRHLRVNDLTRVAATEMKRVGDLIETQHGLRHGVDWRVPLALVMREGGQTDARTVKARAEAFLKEEVFKTCRLFSAERAKDAIGRLAGIDIAIDPDERGEQEIFGERQPPPSVLLVAESGVAALVAGSAGGVDWRVAANAEQAFDALAKSEADFVLLDLALRPLAARPAVSSSGEPVPDRTLACFDHAPAGARRYAHGQLLLEQLHTRAPETPVFLLGIRCREVGLRGFDEELLAACIRSGGARGALNLDFDPGPEGRGPGAEAFAEELAELARRLRLERSAVEMARQNQVLQFDAVPRLNPDGTRLDLRLRNFRRARAVRGADASALVSDADRPSTLFSDVFGAAGAKEALGFIRDWLRQPKKYAAAGVDAPRGVLLTGPPGTGKTMLARALAGESRCAFLAESASAFVTRYTGSGPEAIRALYSRARRYAPSVVFIDEIDAIGGSRGAVSPGHVGHAEAITLNQLLTEMDGFGKGSAAVITLAATNHAGKLDAALLRRFSRVIEVELPTRGERRAYLEARLAAKARHQVSAQMLDRLAAQSQGRSVADLERVMAQASVLALANEGVIDDAVLNEAFERVFHGEARPGGDPLRTARHEAGHAVVMAELGSPPIYVTIVGRGSFGGYAATDSEENRGGRTRTELENMICQLVAGREAERLCYGPGEGDSTGPSNDLERATGIASAMVYELGMSEEIGFVHLDRNLPLPGPLAERCQAAVRSVLDGQTARARAILTGRREGLDRVVAALIERSRLLRDELLSLLDGNAG